MTQLTINENESIDQFICRICNEVRIIQGWTWQETADHLNTVLNENKTKNAYRKRSAKFRNRVSRKDPNQLTFEQWNDSVDTESAEYSLWMETIKERKKISDERVQISALVRRLAREDTIKEIALEVANTFEHKWKFEVYPDENRGKGKKEAILQISDWHYGIEIDSVYNQYNTEITYTRTKELVKEVAERCSLYDVRRIHVVNLSDLIAGRIHLRLRLNSRIDVITQIIQVSELLANVLHALSKVAKIDYYDTADNHSRIEPNIKDSLDLETLTRVTTWFLKERFKNDPNITIHENVLGDDIVSFNCLGHNIIAVHGDKDKPETAVKNLSTFTKDYYDLLLTSHVHHFNADEVNETIQLCNGSLMGTDQYAQQLRRSARPSQNLIIVTQKNVIDSIHRIVLD